MQLTQTFLQCKHKFILQIFPEKRNADYSISEVNNNFLEKMVTKLFRQFI